MTVGCLASSSLSLHFLNYRMAIVTPASKSCEDKGYGTGKAQGKIGPQQILIAAPLLVYFFLDRLVLTQAYQWLACMCGLWVFSLSVFIQQNVIEFLKMLS